LPTWCGLLACEPAANQFEVTAGASIGTFNSAAAFIARVGDVLAGLRADLERMDRAVVVVSNLKGTTRN
jgi:hypothetical protein